MENIVITGIGIVSPLGIGKEEFWENDLSGKSKISICEDMVNNHMSSRTSSKINDDKLEKYLDSLDEELLSNQSRFAKIAYIAAQEAISDSQLDNYYNKNKIGVIGSSAIGGTPEIQKTYEYLTNNGKDELIYKDVGEEFYNHGMFNYPATVISKHYNFTGISTSLSTGCTAGMDALITGLQLLNQNELDAVVVGSAESPLCTLTYSTLNAIGALSTWTGDPRESSRPFDQKRCGFVISEASAYLVLERETLAKKRNAKIYGKIKGVASLCNAEHMTDLKNPTVLSEVIRQTLAKSTLTPEQIDYINAHGSSTLQNDKCESEAINSIFNDLTALIPVSSTKSMMGHPLASASLVALISTLGAMKHSIVPPNVNYHFEDPDCSLNIVQKPYPKEINNALVMASGFGGIHSACIVGK